MITIANPIYDSVFKYLLEDLRVTKTIISALLKKEVVSVQMRKHELSNSTRDKISMFRIDFSAEVRQDDGTTKLVLIELQKTWLDTETLRFRQYLGAQYSDPANMVKEKGKLDYGIPMITVYLLGHRVGDIEEPVLYVSHKSYDYNGNEVTKGLPDSFVDSLVHDSIIVQIPLLRGTINNRLEAVLSVFDQSNIDGNNHQVLNINDEEFEGDQEMERIFHRLLKAAADSKMRQNMNAEDEFFSAIEDRDTAIMQRDKTIEEKNETIKEKNETIKEKNETILASAKAMKQMGMPASKIAEITKLSEDEINKL